MPLLPTAEEQLYLELINRARQDPEGEFDHLILDADSQTGVTSDITAAIRYFDVDMDLLAAQLASYDPVAPLAWNTALATSSDSHTDLMIRYDRQSHNLPGEPGLGQRFIEAGYDTYSAIAENVFAYADDTLYGHAGFYIDWGFTATGIQEPAGHRNAILSATYTELGVASVAETDPGTDLGPYVVTQHFGTRRDYEAQLVGVVIDDADGDAFYDIGEGLGGVTVTATGAAGTFTTTSWEAGGYQMVLPAGRYTVTFEGGGLTGIVTASATFADENVKLDARAQDAVTAAPLRLTGGAADETLSGDAGNDTLSGGGGNDRLDGAGGADALTGGIGFDAVTGGAGNDTATGGDGYDTLQGGGGNDSLSSNNGLDLIEGGAGDDTATGGLGADTLRGEDGADLLSGQNGGDLLSGGADNDTLNGNAGADTLEGDGGDDLLSGGIGADLLRGQAGADTLGGGNGADSLEGGAGHDRLSGNSGADTLAGGAGDDVLVGGLGADVFVFGRGDGKDRIADLGNVDRVALDAGLLTEATPLPDDLRGYATLNADGFVVLSFGADSLTFTGITHVGALLDDVVFV